MNEFGGNCPRRHEPKHPRRDGNPYLCGPAWPIWGGSPALTTRRHPISQVLGASEAAKPTDAGRIDAEWCPTRAKVRRSSWPVRRRRAGGGVKAAGARVLPGSPVGQPMTTDHATAAVQEPIGPETTAQPPPGGRAAGPAKITGSLPAGVGMPATRAPARTWGGAGGRWLVWVFRAIAWTVLLVIGFRGVAAIITGQPLTGRSAAGVQTRQRGFPVSLARAYALAFGQVYLNYNSATAAHRAAALATFLPPGVDPQLGWSRTGAQTLQFEQVAGVQVADRHRAVVTLLARISGHLIEVGVPIYATSAGMVVSGHPAMLPAPSNIAVPAPSAISQDPSAKLALKRMLPGFFRAYASGDAVQLAMYSPRGTVITGLGRVVAFGGLVRLVVPAATGRVRHIAVMVRWLPVGSAARPAGSSPSPSAGRPSPSAGTPSPSASSRSPSAGSRSPSAGSSGRSASVPGSMQMSYELTVVRHGSTWLVRAIGPASSQAWPSS